MTFYFIQAGTLQRSEQPPPHSAPFAQQGAALLPPLISALHENFAAWAQAGFSPGPIYATRIWVGRDGALAFRFPAHCAPQPLPVVGLAPDLAAWLVLLDQWMETFVVVARARSVWTPAQLGSAIPFLSPAYLPPELTGGQPETWQRLAAALALAVVDGPLSAAPANRHWRKAATAQQGAALP